MSTEVIGIDKPVEIDRKENLRDHRWYWIGRRTQDVILSSLALVVLSPVMLATAIAIVVDDPSAGPIFSQERIGRNGKPFKFSRGKLAAVAGNDFITVTVWPWAGNQRRKDAVFLDAFNRLRHRIIL